MPDEILWVIVPVRDREPVLPFAARTTEFRQERIRSDGVLCDDSFPIDEAMLWRAELERRRSRREMLECSFQFAERRFW